MMAESLGWWRELKSRGNVNGLCRLAVVSSHRIDAVSMLIILWGRPEGESVAGDSGSVSGVGNSSLQSRSGNLLAGILR